MHIPSLLATAVFMGSLVCLALLLRAIFVYPRFKKVSRLLNSGISSFSLFRWQTRGLYRGRTINYDSTFGDDRGDRFYVQPQYNSPEEKLFILHYPKPTKNTFLIRGRVVLYPPSKLTQDKIIEIFDELVNACEIVERGLSYYSQKASLKTGKTYGK